jgi:phosphopantothenoylcysteine decarboxylase/phosphopantothenate--cysteine ligase
VQTIRVTSAQEMHDAVHQYVHSSDVFIAVAAVADYRPVKAAPGKIKKDAERLTLELVRNPDILSSVTAAQPAPFTVGFAAETENVEANARAKLETKRLDLVCANRVALPDRGFESDDNSLWLVDREGIKELPLAPKPKLARELVHEIAQRLKARAERLRHQA